MQLDGQSMSIYPPVLSPRVHTPAGGASLLNTAGVCHGRASG
jgi:hypothetical protein